MGGVSDKGNPGAGLVDLPNVESLILVQTLVKLVWRVSLGEDPLPGLVKPDAVWVGHLTNDGIDSVHRADTPAVNKQTNKQTNNKYYTQTQKAFCRKKVRTQLAVHMCVRVRVRVSVCVCVYLAPCSSS